MNPKTLQYLMGHSDIGVTFNTYTQLILDYEVTRHSDIGVTLNTYTHLGLEDAENELHKMEEVENARKEMEKDKDKEKPVSQVMFKAI